MSILGGPAHPDPLPPLLPPPFPRVVRHLHQVELTSRCQLRCSYCPNSLPTFRPKLDMTEAHLRAALCHVVHGIINHAQAETNIAGIGESTIHPQFVEFVAIIRATVGPAHPLILATNGVDLTERIADALARHNVQTYVSLHQPARAANAVRLLSDRKILVGVTCDAASFPNDWAGQVKWLKPTYTLPCPWLNAGWAMAMADGRVTTCCLDASGVGVVGHVEDAVGSLQVRPYGLCRTCYQRIDEPSWDQVRGEWR